MTDHATSRETSAVVMAAGQGTRMKSARPKVLHAVAGRPIVFYPVRAALEAGCAEVVVVVGHGREEVESYLRAEFGGRVRIAVQSEQRGTGDAARVGLAAVRPGSARVVVCNGDLPLLVATDLAAVLAAPTPRGSTEGGLAMATCSLADPTGYGRIVRDASGAIVAIREHRDLQTSEERAITEINPGIYVAAREFFAAALAELHPDNAQGELYLTDVVALARARGESITGIPSRPEVLVGVNDRTQLVEAEALMHERIARRWRAEGATVRAGALVDDGVTLAPDVTIEGGARLRGATVVRRGARVDVGCVLTDATIGEDVELKPYSVVTRSEVKARAQIGPFAHLRPDSVIGEEAHVGNFVETKKTTMAKGAKANHLAYLGDGVIGERANVGAGTIFCNYDGVRKHTTVIEAGAFIGSDSQLVAPVTVGEGAYVATGTTVTRDVPKGALAIARVRQDNKEGYADRLRARFKGGEAPAKPQGKG